MAMYRKLGKKTKLRKALLHNQVTQLVFKGKIITTEARAKEVQKIIEPMITMAVKEKDNFDTVTVQVKQAQKDKDGKRVKEEKDGKKVTVYDTVDKEIVDIGGEQDAHAEPQHSRRTRQGEGEQKCHQ